jgi:DNA-nicking Smr family endonuclease|tara:strand:+ start:279 stop:872 length:594 start_codon:yes stop_codon:yes gene_type:complete
LFNKKYKKLSEEDLENWDRLKNTLDFKFYKKSYQIKEFEKTKQLYKDYNKVEQYIPKQHKIVRNGIANRKFLNNYQLQDIRIDKNKLSLLKRGKIKPEKILDLHGLTSVEAKTKAIEFTKINFNLGLRLLLIITGKGKIKINDLNREELKPGVLRKSLKSWLYDSDLRPNILGIISSHISHGGEGAFYVYLKSNKIL